MERNIPGSSQNQPVSTQYQPVELLEQANVQQGTSALDMVADWLSKQQESTATAQCSSLAADIGRALIIADDGDGSLMESVSSMAAERAEPIQAERSGTPTPEESWIDNADVQCLEIQTDNSRPHNVQGLPGIAIDVLRDYYSNGPDATRQKACYAPFYEYWENNATVSTHPTNFQFKRDDYLKMFVHEDALVPKQSEHNGRYVLEESLLWPKDPGLVFSEDSDTENQDPNIAGSHRSRELEDTISEPSLKYKRIESKSGRSDKPQVGLLDSVSSPRDRLAVLPPLVNSVDGVVQGLETGHTKNQPIFAFRTKRVSLGNGERIPGPSRLAPAPTDLRFKLNAKVATGSAPQKASGTGNSSFGSQANSSVGSQPNQPMLSFPGGSKDSGAHQTFTSYQLPMTASATILSDSSSDEEGCGRCRRRFSRTEISNAMPRRRLFSISKGFSSQESLEYAKPLTREPSTSPKPPVKFQKEKILDEWGEDLDYELSSDDQEDMPGADGPPTPPDSINKASEESEGASVHVGQSDVKKLSQKLYYQRI